MSTSIHGVVEYQDQGVPSIRWSLGEVFFPSTYTDIQELLGMWPDEAPGIVPQRGHPSEAFEERPSSDYHNGFAALVVRGSATANCDFDEYGTYRESDGLVLNEDAAQRWLDVGSKWLDDDWHGDYRRISDPDMRNVNWITTDEYESVIRETEKRSPDAQLGTHRAVLASMKSLVADGYSGVRLVYGGS